MSLSGLRAKDEAPYPAAIAAGVKLIMASWAVYPALDANHPAGLSPAVIQGELRGRLGYRGVTITDAIEAGALAAFGSSGQRAVLAAQAGMDLLLCSARNPAQGQAVVTALAGALDGGQLNRPPSTPPPAGDRAAQRPAIWRRYARASSCFHSAMASPAHSACRRANRSAAAVPRHGAGRNWAGRPGSIHGNRRQACTRSMTRTSGSGLTCPR